MMASLIGIDIRGVEPLTKYLDDLKKAEIAKRASEEVAKYLLNVLRTYPPYQYVSRANAYPDAPAGPGWFSDKQRRWFFAALANGELNLPYQRTQGLSRGWQIVGSGDNIIIVNETDYGIHVMGDSQGEFQSRMSARIGWKTMPYILSERQDRITKIIEGVAKKYIRD